jgi:hypothetical protein
MKAFVITLLLLVATGRAEAQIDSAIALPPAFIIDSLSVSHGSSPNIGDTVYLNVRFTAFVTRIAAFDLNFEYPIFIAPLNQDTGVMNSETAITVDSGSSYSFSVPLKLFAYGFSTIQIFISPDSQRASYAPGYGYVTILFSSSSLAIQTGPLSSVSEAMQPVNNFNAYPNPMNHQTMITWNTGDTKDVPLRVSIFDALGRLVQSYEGSDLQQSSSGSLNVSASTLPAGIYTASIFTRNATQVLRLSVMH